MSIAVDVNKLGEEMERFGQQAYLLSVNDDATAHIAHLTFALADGTLRCGASKTAARNVKSRPRVSVLWPPYEAGGYSMIVDGDCEPSNGTAPDGGDELVITPATGVLHRPAAGGGAVGAAGGADGAASAGDSSAGDSTDGACESDCQPLGG